MTGLTIRRVLIAGGLGFALFSLSACDKTGIISGEQHTSQLNDPHADPKNNIASITAVGAQNPRDAKALSLRGTAYGQAGDYEKALADFSAAIRINPQFYQAYNNRALILLRMGRLDAALSDYNQAIVI